MVWRGECSIANCNTFTDRALAAIVVALRQPTGLEIGFRYINLVVFFVAKFIREVIAEVI